MFKIATFAALLSAITLPALADGFTVGDLMIVSPWMRATTSVATSSGGYLTIHNHGATDERLLSASAEFAKVQIHLTVQEDGVNRMQEQVDGIVIPAGESLTLAPGSYHIMLMGLESGLEMGASREITLMFEQAGEVTVEFEAAMRQAPGAADHDMSDRGEMHGSHDHDHDTQDHTGH